MFGHDRIIKRLTICRNMVNYDNKIRSQRPKGLDELTFRPFSFRKEVNYNAYWENKEAYP